MPKTKKCQKGFIKKCIKKEKKSKTQNLNNQSEENTYNIRTKELGSMVDKKFSKIKRKDVSAQMIFWFDGDISNINNYPFVFYNDFPIKKSRDLKDGFTIAEKKSVIDFFSKNQKMTSNKKGENDLSHPKEILATIVGSQTPLKIKKTEVKFKYLFPNQPASRHHECSGYTKKWKCNTNIPILCVLVRYKFALTKEIIKENIDRGVLPWSIIDEDTYYDVYQGPNSKEWKNGKLNINKRGWGQNLIDHDQGDYDGTYRWAEGAFKFGLNEDCFSII